MEAALPSNQAFVPVYAQKLAYKTASKLYASRLHTMEPFLASALPLPSPSAPPITAPVLRRVPTMR